MVPMPLAPPCTSSVSPGSRWATMKTLDQTVHVDLGQRRGLHQSDARPAPAAAARRAPRPARRTRRRRAARTPRRPPPSRPRRGRGGDPAGALQPRVGGRAGRRRVEALALQDVGAVDRARGHLDDDLVLARLGLGDLRPQERLGTTRFRNRDRMHAARLPPPFRPPGGSPSRPRSGSRLRPPGGSPVCPGRRVISRRTGFARRRRSRKSQCGTVSSSASAPAGRPPGGITAMASASARPRSIAEPW